MKRDFVFLLLSFFINCSRRTRFSNWTVYILLLLFFSSWAPTYLQWYVPFWLLGRDIYLRKRESQMDLAQFATDALGQLKWPVSWALAHWPSSGQEDRETEIFLFFSLSQAMSRPGRVFISRFFSIDPIISPPKSFPNPKGLFNSRFVLKWSFFKVYHEILK